MSAQEITATLQLNDFIILTRTRAWSGPGCSTKAGNDRLSIDYNLTWDSWRMIGKQNVKNSGSESEAIAGEKEAGATRECVL